MRIEGLHHITAISSDAQRTLDFYSAVLGLRLVKKTVNFDQPDVYHLYFGDDHGLPGSLLTFFEFPRARPGRAGVGMVHTVTMRIPDQDALDFWDKRLTSHDIAPTHIDGGIRFADPDGLEIEFQAGAWTDPNLIATDSAIPPEFAIAGLAGVRAYPLRSVEGTALLLAMGFEQHAGSMFTVSGNQRHAFLVYDDPPAEPGIPGAGTVHHIAWAAHDNEHESWRSIIEESGCVPTPVIDRKYFKSIYFRGHTGILFELATHAPGFTVDESPGHLGENLCLPTNLEKLRDKIEAGLTPLTCPAQNPPK